MAAPLLLVVAALAAGSIEPGDHTRTIRVDALERNYLIHVPPKYDRAKPTPVVLVLHGAGSSAAMTVGFTGMSRTSDEAGFIAVYPNGTGFFRTFNAFGRAGGLRANQTDDVKYISRLLDDLATVINVDPRRVYATGMSNGGMMCHRLAAELSDRIAAVAPVAGTLSIDGLKPKRPISVMHFHGTADTLVPWDGPRGFMQRSLNFKSVAETIAFWVKTDGCPDKPRVQKEPDRVNDGTTVVRTSYGPGKDGAEVILFTIEGGGHTWPGQKPPVFLLGKSTLDISANDLMWEFFLRHPLPAPVPLKPAPHSLKPAP
jgi:polyhydroxybutyrate depolymerase